MSPEILPFPPQPMRRDVEKLPHDGTDRMDEEVSSDVLDVLEQKPGAMPHFAESFPHLMEYAQQNEEKIGELFDLIDEQVSLLEQKRNQKDIKEAFHILCDLFDHKLIESLPGDEVRQEVESLICLQIDGFEDFIGDAKVNLTKETAGSFIDILPFVWVPKMIIDTLRWKEFISGNDLNFADKWINVAFIILGLFGGNIAKGAISGVKIGRNVMRIAAAVRKTMKLRYPARGIRLAGKFFVKHPHLAKSIAQTSVRKLHEKRNTKVDWLHGLAQRADKLSDLPQAA